MHTAHASCRTQHRNRLMHPRVFAPGNDCASQERFLNAGGNDTLPDKDKYPLSYVGELPLWWSMHQRNKARWLICGGIQETQETWPVVFWGSRSLWCLILDNIIEIDSEISVMEFRSILILPKYIRVVLLRIYSQFIGAAIWIHPELEFWSVYRHVKLPHWKYIST